MHAAQWVFASLSNTWPIRRATWALASPSSGDTKSTSRRQLSPKAELVRLRLRLVRLQSHGAETETETVSRDDIQAAELGPNPY
jgi:hypothetical protein